MAMTPLRRTALTLGVAAALLLAPSTASAFTWEQCTFDATTGTLDVTPEVLSGESFDALVESWDGSFTCGIFEAEQTIQLSALNKVVVHPQTASSWVAVPAWLSERAGHEVDVDVVGRSDLADQRVGISSVFDSVRDDAVGRQVKVVAGATGSDLDRDGDLEYTVSGGLEWNISLYAEHSWGTVDLRSYRAPKGAKSYVLMYGQHRSTVYAPTLGGGVAISTGKAADIVYGGAGRDEIETGAGNDLVHGGGGNDLIRSGEGNDKLYGQGGRDQLEGGDGNDLLDGGPGDDYAFPDDMRGDTDAPGADDVVRLGDGVNMTITKYGNDVITGGPLTDFVRAKGAVLTIRSGAGRDVIDIDGWEHGTTIDCEAGIDWRRYPAGIHFPPQRHCERYTRKDPRRMAWRPVGIGISWVT
jgi:Ca2+-binding RTX toxin-like protein